MCPSPIDKASHLCQSTKIPYASNHRCLFSTYEEKPRLILGNLACYFRRHPQHISLLFYYFPVFKVKVIVNGRDNPCSSTKDTEYIHPCSLVWSPWEQCLQHVVGTGVWRKISESRALKIRDDTISKTPTSPYFFWRRPSTCSDDQWIYWT